MANSQASLTEARVSCNSRGVHGEDAVYSSRAERSRDSADFIVLAEGQAIVINLVPHQDWVTPLMTSSTRR